MDDFDMDPFPAPVSACYAGRAATVCAGDQHVMMLTTAGVVYAAGGAEYGRLGRETRGGNDGGDDMDGHSDDDIGLCCG